ncbi:MAG: S8 family serine peptidase, partial [Verrucomicrobia bacterium]|nr:S8 family serine peptidase [Verrucomicrobiota bacterium]
MRKISTITGVGLLAFLLLAGIVVRSGFERQRVTAPSEAGRSADPATPSSGRQDRVASTDNGPSEEPTADASAPSIVRRNLSDPAVRESYVAELQARERDDEAAAESAAAKAEIPRRGEVDGQTYEIAAVRDGRVYVRTTHNVNAAISTAADRLRQAPYNLDGSGLTVAVWDAGAVRPTHQELVGRVTLVNSVSAHTHSTHVGGTIGAAGVNAFAKGMAPNVNILSYDWNSDISEMAARGMSVPGEANKIQLSNHSYGFQAGWAGLTWFGSWGSQESDGFGLYDSFCAQLDDVCYNAPYYLPFKAAGNDRNDSSPFNGQSFTYFDQTGAHSKIFDSATDPFDDYWDNGGYDTIAYESNAKNMLAVGAVDDAVSGGLRSLADATMAAFSSWGPTDDGRIKPDLVANGVSLNSTLSTSDTGYGTVSGTSMATPNAMGSTALLLEHYGALFPGRYLLASAIKALLVHTADDLGNPGPDYRFGWGLMNAIAAAEHLNAHARLTNAFRVVEDKVTLAEQTRTYDFLWDNISPIHATLAWTDPAGDVKNTLDDRTPVLVHDLDLRIIAPDGVTNFPFVLSATNPVAVATQGDNDVDNVEQVRIATPTVSGVYHAVVTVEGGGLLAAEQQFALMIGGGTQPPAFVHEPMANTTNTLDPLVVTVDVESETPLDTNALWMVWATGGPVASNPLYHVTNQTYQSTIPAQPAGTTISYFFEATTTNGIFGRGPVDAPASQYSFAVVESVVLLVTGQPSKVPGVTPDYGIHLFPSGVTVNASAIDFGPPSFGIRDACVGWTGNGSVPASGKTNTLSFDIDGDSYLAWQWRDAYRLLQSSSPPGILAAETWWVVGTTAQTIEAAATVDIGGTNYAFAGWTVDGVRQPDATNTASNPADAFVMNAPRSAQALYLPTTLDADGDGVPDWWEFYYLGGTNVPLNVDLDGDGFSNQREFDDKTDPQDPASVPTAPAIAHTPLSSPRTFPAPWSVAAVVTDNDAVDTVRLEWNRNGLGWQSILLEPATAPDTFTNDIPAPGVSGDAIQYRLVARDRAGLQAVNGTYALTVAYPIVHLSPTNFGTIKLPETGTRREVLSIGNDGHAALDWTLRISPAGLYDDVEGGDGDWTHGGVIDEWHRTSYRAHSGTSAWYFGSETIRAYSSSAKAWLASPAVLVPQGGVFSFWQWLDTEGLKDPVTAWDGAIVEISTNGGATFASLEPEGGYPYSIYGHPAAPFPGGTPCLAGTGGWEQVFFPITNYAGQVVQLRLHFGSDGFVVSEGWYVDDLTVSPFDASNDWITAHLTGGSAAALGANLVQLSLVTEPLDYSETRDAILFIETNDPIEPDHEVRIALHNLTREILVRLTGNGTVDPAGPVILDLGDSTNFVVTAAAYNHLRDVFTNGGSIGGPFELVTTNVDWSTISFDGPGDFHAIFAANLTTNGVAESWLVAHGLTNSDFEVEAMTDQDLDRMLAWEEFIAGTDPTNAASVFKFDGILSDGPTVETVFEWTNGLDEVMIETQCLMV